MNSVTSSRALPSLPRFAGNLARRFRYHLWLFGAMQRRGSAFHCPVCDWSFRTMLTLRGACSISGELVDLTTTNADCPRCHSGIRQRFAFEVLRQRTLLKTAPMRVVHFAPDPGIYAALRRRRNIDYIAADLNPARFAKATKLDITAINLLPESVDGIICIHVLEHIADDRQAISELFRILRPGGWALIAVPTYGMTTYEDPELDYLGRERMYGAGDHMRLNGLDFAYKLRNAGFAVETIALTDIPGNFVDLTLATPHIDSDRHIFLCRRK